jgi:low temperature requirement protein LtrA
MSGDRPRLPSPPRLARRAVPRLRLQEADTAAVERHATWTELFFDLVFVVAIAQLAAGLHGNLTASGALTFAGLFVPVWWTWTTYAYVADLFDADDAPFRAVLLGAMLFVAGLAATLPAAFDGRTGGFIVAYALLRADLLGVYAWAWRSDRSLRDLVVPHLAGFGLGGAVFLASLALPAPWRYVAWGVAIAVDLATGLVAYLRSRDVPQHRSHMPERFGLFVLIVLGESVIAVSTGTAASSWAFDSVVTAGLGFAVAAALWWMYFARFDDTVFDWAFAGGMRARRRSFVFGYGHLVVCAALTAVGVGVRVAIEHAVEGEHAARAAAVLGIALAAYLLSLAGVQWATPSSLPPAVLAGRAAVAAAALVLAATGADLGALALLAIAAALVLGQVVAEALASAAR